jgi:DNA-binding SARP family transcriptional activator/tetratricopeptide (TPR) repeat protein
MWFGLLGPLQVRAGDREIRIPGARQRVLLAALLLTPGRVVSAARLAELVWDGQPPGQAAGTIRSYVQRLRQALGPAGKARILTVGGGYMIDMTAGQLDIAQFENLLRTGVDAAKASDWQRAAVLLDQAQALWRGSPLADIACQALQLAEPPRLEEERLQAIQWRMEAGLQLGQHDLVIPQLRSLTAEHPLREALHGQLMVALYRCGRQADALTAYRTARGILVSELGLEPGPDLQLLQQRIIAGDRELLAVTNDASGQPASQDSDPTDTRGRADTTETTAGQPDARVPRQLPAAVSHFTGRAAELDALTGVLDASRSSRSRTVVISALAGAAGVGKTALAVRWAHQVAERFRDGQLYVNLRGYDPDEPVAATDALADLLGALGVPGQEIPEGADERARLFRSRLAGRRVLVLLDNARNAEQVRPLLPGDPGCVAVVTSRDSLAGLVAADGARRLDLDVLPLAEAVGLLRALIGPRINQDPAATVALAGLCARLPLALRIAAELAAARPDPPVAELVAELEESRLDLLDAGEDRADVRAVFSWSVRQLPDEVAGAFALVGLHPGEDLDAHAAAALTDTTVGQARRVLARLHRASLVQAAGSGRYGMHDLLRAYAREQAAAGDSCQQALTRLFDYYLSAAAAAMDVLIPAEAHRRPRVPPSAAAIPALPGQAEAQAWLDTERANLVAVVVHCAGHGWAAHATGMAATLFRYLISGSHLPEAQTVYSRSLQAARQSGDLAAEAEALNGLGGIGMIRGHPQAAAENYRAALERYQQCGDRAGQARATLNLGGIEHQLHNLRSAASYCRQAITASEEADDSLGVARALCSLAGVETDLGSYAQAASQLGRALRTFRKAKDQLYEAYALERIGELNLRRGQLTEAADYYEQALAINRRIDNATGIAHQLLSLGDVSQRQGAYQQAVGYQRRALDQFRHAGNQHGEFVTLRALAEALHGIGQPAEARAELQAACLLASETGNTYQQASAHRELAESHHRAGNHEQAQRNWQQALDLYTQLGVPEADQVRSRIKATQKTTAQPRPSA